VLLIEKYIAGKLGAIIMANMLVVPIYLDALVLEKTTPAVEAFADFSRLPYFSGERDINPDVPHISEEILSQPFQNQNLYLKPGVHLHWAIPDALTTSSRKSGGKDFPDVPNRWLITRKGKKVVKQWVVESDYLSATGSESNPEVTYPVGVNSKQPFGYLGRCLQMEEWSQNAKNSANRHLERLTAVGYGEPAFAAFYPNCHSVFGFYDDEITDIEELNGVTYEILGWYLDTSKDFLAIWINVQGNSVNPALTLDGQLEALKEINGWNILERPKEMPGQMVCYAQIRFGTVELQNSKTADISVTIGNTSTEALSAYLANQLITTDKSTIEEQLEALHLSAGLENRRLDVGPKFKEARHTKGFRPMSAGVIWTLRPDTSSQPEWTGSNSDQVTLPIELAELLNELNDLQQQYDQAGFEFESLRRQLSADWYKYMLCAYPPLDGMDEYPNIDEVKRFIENHDIEPLHKKKDELEKSSWQLLDAKKQLEKQVNTEGGGYVLKTTHAPRFWEPSDPVVLLAGDIAKSTDRHGPEGELQENGLLKCGVISSDAFVFNTAEGLNSMRDAINSHLGTLGSQTWQGQPWNPIMLEWEVEFFPIGLGNNIHFDDLTYDHNFIRMNYSLPDNASEFKNTHPPTAPAANVYTGRSILTPHAKNQLMTRLETRLTNNASDDHPDIYDEAKKKLENTNILAQALGGFNQALLMHKQTLQLPIMDPIGFDEYRDFTKKVREMAWGDSAPQPLNNFNPIRAGKMKILRLRLIDTFGQVRDIPCENILSAETLPVNEEGIALPPRLVQPARLNFRWLSAVSVEGDLEAIFDKTRTAFEQKLDNNKIDIDEQIASRLDSAIEKMKRDIKARFDQRYSGKFGWVLRLLDRILPLPQAVTAWFDEADGIFHHDLDELKTHIARQIEQLISALKPILDNGQRDVHNYVRGLPQNLQAAGKIFEQKMIDRLDELSKSLEDLEESLTKELNQKLDDATSKGAVVLEGLRDTHKSLFEKLMSFLRKILKRGKASTMLEVDSPPAVLQTEENGQRSNRQETEKGSRGADQSSEDGLAPFRWRDELEMNDHPATTPICGWILPNNLDGSLMVYDQGGQTLGYFDQDKAWCSAPGRPSMFIRDIPNRHLRKVIDHISRQDADFFTEFLIAIENALENIDPDNFNHNEAMALLMGRPIAVVRASLNFELRGRPAINQDWNVFQQDMQGSAMEKDSQGIEHLVRTTDGFTKVAFPIRIGEYHQLNDGLVGYWVEQEDGNLEDMFYAPQTSSTEGMTSSNIRIHNEKDPAMIYQSLDDPPHKLTMLVDPRGVVHATSGILPTKSIHLPADQFADQLRAIEVTFLSAPILTDVGGINLPLPDEPGYVWSWLEKENGVWDDESQIGPVDAQAKFKSKQIIREGWLKLRQKPDDQPTKP
jgi:hypothetical protein